MVYHIEMMLPNIFSIYYYILIVLIVVNTLGLTGSVWDQFHVLFCQSINQSIRIPFLSPGEIVSLQLLLVSIEVNIYIYKIRSKCIKIK